MGVNHRWVVADVWGEAPSPTWKAPRKKPLRNLRLGSLNFLTRRPARGACASPYLQYHRAREARSRPSHPISCRSARCVTSLCARATSTSSESPRRAAYRDSARSIVSRLASLVPRRGVPDVPPSLAQVNRQALRRSTPSPIPSRHTRIAPARHSPIAVSSLEH